MDYETQEMCHIYKNYITFKDEYEDFKYRINKIIIHERFR